MSDYNVFQLGDDIRVTRCCSESQDVLKVYSVGNPGSRTVWAGDGKDEFAWPFVDIAVAKGRNIHK